MYSERELNRWVLAYGGEITQTSYRLATNNEALKSGIGVGINMALQNYINAIKSRADIDLNLLVRPIDHIKRDLKKIIQLIRHGERYDNNPDRIRARINAFNKKLLQTKKKFSNNFSIKLQQIESLINQNDLNFIEILCETFGISYYISYTTILHDAGINYSI
ncbi:hypothetical protein PV326_001624 [Microctonus aethiopoides]|nr:hypothetical protein PV326_001624 [Microctonus aethiopoides]